MLDFLYTVFISPVESIVEFIFYFVIKIFADKPVVAIVFVSLAVNLLILPLYKRADDMQEQEREKIKSMDRWNKHIKKTFKGDERYMMQTAYYRIEGYKPISAIAGSLSLLFQIPFFIAAYHFLSNVEILKGAGTFMISDLGAPDAMFKIGGFSVNVLPILMTAINIVSGVIYTKGFKLKEKIQLYAMALLFLVVLYNSPSGLVIYWTLNNLFSLLKNVFFKLIKRRRLVINIISALAGTGLFAVMLKSHRLTVRRQFFIFAILMFASFVPALLSLLAKCNFKFREKLTDRFAIKESEKKHINALYWLGAALNTVILGIMIPAATIESAPTEFGTLVSRSPLQLILFTFAFFIGVFFVWMGIFFAISKTQGKAVFAYGLWIYGICSLVNYYGFFGKFGTMDHLLRFVTAPVYTDLGKLINLAILAPIVIALLFIVRKWSNAATKVLSILIIMTSVLSINNIYSAQKLLVTEGYYIQKQDKAIVPTVPISKKGKNVIVIMLDRAINEYVPYIFKELPEVAEDFKDFVYYPNTISFGGCTNFAAPALFGGYEYTPAAMNRRDTEPLVKKHNESILALPVLFAENGYDVNVLDPVYANYQDIPDLSIYDEYENISAHITRNKYAEYAITTDAEKNIQNKHMAYYSLFRTVPVLLQNSIYDNGDYLGKPMLFTQSTTFTYCAEGYALLDHFDEYTYIENDDKGKFLVMTNNLTHEPTFLRKPNYEIGELTETYPYSEAYLSQFVLDGKVLSMPDYSCGMHYDVNAAAYRLLGEYFDHLKKEGVYDNTRIIIVSDHGWPVYQMEGVSLDAAEASIETFNPVLLVKDFKDSDALSQGEVWHWDEANVNVCDTFMTNADVATLCVTGLIDNPINPFTGKVIDNEAKKTEPLLVTTSQQSSVYDNCGNTYDTSDHPWVEFSGDNVKDLKNWTILSDK